MKQLIDARRVEKEPRQKPQQPVEALLKPLGIEPQPEAHDCCDGSRRNIVHND